MFGAFVAKAQIYDWTAQIGEEGSDASHALATDKEGNVFVGGYFESAKMKLGEVTLVNKKAGELDILIAKYDPTGKLLWAKSAGGEGDDRAEAICTDSKGNCYITGYFTSKEVQFDSQKISSKTENRAWDEFYIAKYSPSGNVVWVKSIKSGPSQTNGGHQLCADPSGNIIVTGGFQSEKVTFGDFTLVNANKGKGDIYLVKYSTNGDVIWAKQAGGNGFDLGTTLDIAPNGSIILGGFFNQVINFGTTRLEAVGDADAFISRYDADGNVLWAVSYGGSKFEGINCLALDDKQNILVTGNSSSTDMRLGLRNINHKGRTNVFVCKLDFNGMMLWDKSSLQDDGYTQSNSLVVDAAGNCIIYGDYKGKEMSFGNLKLPASSPNNFFYLVKFDGKTGEDVKVAYLDMGFGYTSVGWMGIDAKDNVAITGSFMEKELKIDKRTLQNRGFYDIFVSHLKF